jgi:D-alanyl-D-alanine carboxypeptidase/D-alanyl-D-alanine-endopeptidase (penicillin-binding protein 4)
MGIAGKDGTLKYRFEGSEAVGRLRGKTGTLENVAALSGYVESIGGEKFAFAVLVNDYLGRAFSVVQALDAMGAAMAASGGPQGPGRAIAAMMNPETAIGSLEELTSRVRTYLSIARPRDRKGVAFLRTAWRSERDPAVRTVIAEALYESDPGDYAAARVYLDSFSADEVVYGRLCRVALALGVDVPGLSPLLELAAQGNPEALGQLLRVAAASREGEQRRKLVATALAEVSRTAPEALLAALRAASSTEREEATGLLVHGLATADADHPLWSALRRMMGSVDAPSASFATQLEQTISQKLASEKGPAIQPAAATGPARAVTPPTAKPEIRPGG